MRTETRKTLKKSLSVVQVRRAIDKKQQITLRGLGLRRIRHVVTVEDTPSIQGMLLKVRHLVEVEAK